MAARKKKVTEEKEFEQLSTDTSKEVNVENNKEENKQVDNQVDNIAYEGRITVKAERNGRILYNKKYKNNGTMNLFNFFCQCLMGSYTSAQKIRPSKILLWQNTNNSSTDAKNNGESINGIYRGTASSTVISETDPPTLNYSTSYNGSDYNYVSATFHFLIPRAFISGQVNEMFLLPDLELVSDSGYDNSVDVAAKACAYFLLASSDGKWQNIDLDSIDGNYNLVVEWELRLSNYQTQSN